MMLPSLRDIDDIKKQGFRPQVVGCVLSNNRVLFLYKKDYDVWGLPQGGIENDETIVQTITREMTEELGSWFARNWDKQIDFILEDQIEFHPSKHNSRILMDDDGCYIHMKGKKYFFFVLRVSGDEINIHDTEFDEYKWVSHEEGINLAKKNYQKGKQRIIIKALNELKVLEFIT